MKRLSSEERRKVLISAAREEFLRSGFEGTRISDIADRAGVNVAMIYRHFDSKDQLFETAILEPIDAFVGSLLGDSVGLVPAGGGFEEYAHAFFRGLLQIFLLDIELFGLVLFGERDSGRDFYQRKVGPFLDTISDLATRNLTEFPSDAFDPALTSPMAVGMVWGVATDAHFRGVDLDLDETAALLSRMTFRGLGG